MEENIILHIILWKKGPVEANTARAHGGRNEALSKGFVSSDSPWFSVLAAYYGHDAGCTPFLGILK